MLEDKKFKRDEHDEVKDVWLEVEVEVGIITKGKTKQRGRARNRSIYTCGFEGCVQNHTWSPKIPTAIRIGESRDMIISPLDQPSPRDISNQANEPFNRNFNTSIKIDRSCGWILLTQVHHSRCSAVGARIEYAWLSRPLLGHSTLQWIRLLSCYTVILAKLSSWENFVEEHANGDVDIELILDTLLTLIQSWNVGAGHGRIWTNILSLF